MLHSCELSTDSKEVILSSWCKGTVKQYKVHHEKWSQYCTSYGNNIDTVKVEHGIEFLTSLYKAGLKYSSINATRSALSYFLGIHRVYTIWTAPFSYTVHERCV